jgi:DNA-dependent RNA polymerase auxiliary subunit epsilon
LRTCPARWTAQTLYVDSTNGKDVPGHISSPECPFNSINFALSTLINLQRNEKVQYVIQVAPGTYPEIVNNLSFVNIIGSATDNTFIYGYKATSTGTLSNITIEGQVLPLISVDLSNNIQDENNFTFSNVNILANNITDKSGQPVVIIKGSGINNLVTFEDVDATFSVVGNDISVPNQIFFDIESSVMMNNINVKQYANFKSEITMFNNNGSLRIKNSVLLLSISDGPSKTVSLFKTGENNTAALFISGVESSVVVTVLSENYKADVNFISSLSADNIQAVLSTAFLDGVSSDFLNLVNAENEFANIQLLGLTTPGLNAPRLKGKITAVQYNILAGSGSVVTNGGLYTNIKTVNDQNQGYYIQEEDSTILSEDTNIFIYDPKLAELQVINKGKIVNIKNIGLSSITIDSQNSSIHDGIIVIQPNQFVTLQSDGNKWYVIGG